MADRDIKSLRSPYFKDSLRKKADKMNLCNGKNKENIKIVTEEKTEGIETLLERDSSSGNTELPNCVLKMKNNNNFSYFHLTLSLLCEPIIKTCDY